MSLKQVRMVMVETSHPGNIGAAARAMKNMQLEQLYLVRPRHFPHPEATARASGSDDVLERVVVCDSLEEAVADCALVFGASARLRTIPWPLVDAREAAQMSLQRAGEGAQVAFVFGRESSGLTNQELERCNYLMHIPTNPDYSSLNVAAALQVVAYELMMGRQGEYALPSAQDDVLATAAEMEGLYGHLEQALVELEFLDPDNPRQLMRRLRRLFNRQALEQTEVNILRGILTAAQKQARR